MQFETIAFFSHAHAQARDRKFAVKVTGDPNVPAGQVAFVVPCQPLLLRASALPCGCRSELRRGIFGAQDVEEDCNCIPLPRANSISGVQHVIACSATFVNYNLAIGA